MDMATFQPADNLRSRTFLGLLVAQFLAAFNDQAIHASSMFFAINQRALNEAQAISLMPILFYAPWAVFCTLAGYLADRYSKRDSLVFWKVVEVGITLIALAGFWMGTHGSPAGPFVVLSTVFLMGMHSAFFVPAKYGAMPEILQPQMLSKGNGILESLSFLAIILGTVFGGVLSDWFRGQEWVIGVILTGLAVVGAVASLLIRRMPAANPGRPFPPYLYQPLWQNVRALLRSRPLALAVVGIAFFTFIVAFMRATVYMHGESHVPRWSESETSLVVGMVALGIGLGSPLVGFLSGGKVELGLVPIGSLGMILAAVIAAAVLGWLKGLIACIILIGFFTGFYIVPLFTLLQHRAPKTSKGDSIATSNFINVTGAIIASLLFFVLVFAAQRTGLAPEVKQRDRVAVGTLVEDPDYERGRPHRFVLRLDGGGEHEVTANGHGRPRTAIEVEGDESIDPFAGRLKAGDRVVESTYRLGKATHHRLRREGEPLRPVYNNSGLPRLLFLGAGLMTLVTLLILWRQMPDLLLRTLIWLRTAPRYRLAIDGMHHLPTDGPVILATNAPGVEACLQVLSATDRTTRFLLAPGEGEGRLPLLLRLQAAGTNVGPLPPGGVLCCNGEDLSDRAARVLARGEVFGLSLTTPGADGLLDRLGARAAVPVLPVYYAAGRSLTKRGRHEVFIVAGAPLPPGTTAEAVRQELARLGEGLDQRQREGQAAQHALTHAH
jgi:MFS family permease